MQKEYMNFIQLKNFMKEIKIKQKKMIKYEMKNRTTKEERTKKGLGKGSKEQIKIGGRVITINEDFNNKLDNFKKIGSNLIKQDIGKRQYSNKEKQIGVINEKNNINTNKRNKNDKYIFANNLRYAKGKILLYDMNIIILLLLSWPMNSSYIELTIRGPGISRVFFNNTGDMGETLNQWCDGIKYPIKVIINNIEQPTVNSEYYLNNSENIVKLEYDTNMDNLLCIFNLCSNITKVDFTNFEYTISSTSYMSSLFSGCTNLTSVNFGNIETSTVSSMANMFENSISLESIDLSNFANTNTFDMHNMFYKCSSLKSIKFSNFLTPALENMNYMFYGCKQLVSVNLSSFDGSKIESMQHIFENCESLVSIDFFKTQTTKVTDMSYMFANCTLLASIDLSNFVSTNSLQYLGSAFKNCFSLEYINLSNLVTINVQNMDFMFYNCISLTSLNLFNFDISQITLIESMFDGCTNLEYINLKKFSEIKELNYSNIFRGLPVNVVICLTEEKTPILASLIKNFTCAIIYCDDNDWKQKQIKMVNNTEKCSQSCNEFINYFYKYDNKCYNECFCESCKENYYPKDKEEKYKDLYFNCYNEPEGYYLDSDNIFKLCYDSCKTCRKEGNYKKHNCLTCKDDFPFGIIYEDKELNCYGNCTYYYFFDNEENYHCTDNFECPKEYDKLHSNRRQCIKDCSNEEIPKYEFQHKCYENCPPKSIKSLEKEFYCEPICDEDNPFEMVETQECVNYCDINAILSKLCITKYKGIIEESGKIIEEEKDINEEIIRLQDKFLDNIEKGFTSDNYNTSGLDSGNDDIIQYHKITITLTTTENQKNSYDKNVTTIDFSGCEKILRNIYNISQDKILYMKKIDVQQEGMKIPKTEYDVYCKLNGTNLVKLNLFYCSDIKIDLSVPVVITENIDVLNTSSGYYNDICYSATSDNGTDITLNDRKNEFVQNNKTVCQENCEFTDYNYDIQKAKCSCKVKESSNSSALMNININEILKNFKDIKNTANVVILQCYNSLFSENGPKGNYGCYIIIFILVVHLVFIFIFYRKQPNDIKEKISNIIYGIKNWHLVKIEEEERERRKSELDKLKQEIFGKEKEGNDKLSILKVKNKKRKMISKTNEDIPKPEKKDEKGKENITKILEPSIEIQLSKEKEGSKIIIKNNLNINNIKPINENEDQFKNKEIIIKVKKIMAFNDEELNIMTYELALKHDNRTYIGYYWSLIKTKNNFIFSFFYNKDYNSRIIKIDLFFISFVIYFTVNALFFNDDTMHQIYEDKGKFQFLYQLPQIIYSSLISIVFNTLLKFLALSESKILALKSIKEDIDINKREENLNKNLQIKFVLYFIISTLFLLFFWYYLSMFCAVYKNTQIHLIKDTLISFSLSFLYPFGIYLFPGLFRIPALSNKKGNRKNLYTISKILQLL